MASVPYTPTSDPTDGERAQLYRYPVANNLLNHHELAQWYEARKYLTLLDINAKLMFERSFDWSISQSTVSLIVRKFNEDPDLLLPAETTQKPTKRKHTLRSGLDRSKLNGIGSRYYVSSRSIMYLVEVSCI